MNIDSWRNFKTSGLVKRDGNKCYRFPKHVREGDYDGLYVTHLASDHDEWVEHRKEWGKNKKEKSGNESSTNSSNFSGLKLKLRENVKKALTTTCVFFGIGSPSFREIFSRCEELGGRRLEG